MKQILPIITVLLFTSSISFGQNRVVVRGADPGELYLVNYWYGIYAPPGPPYYTDLQAAVYRITENGAKLSIQYDEDCFVDNYTTPGSVMLPEVVLADATPGVLYAKRTYIKSDYNDYTQLWVSFDYGKNWMFREENVLEHYYSIGNVEGLLFRGRYNDIFRSDDYGNTFLKFEISGLGMEDGLLYGEGFRLWPTYLTPYKGTLYHSYDFFETQTEFPVDSPFI